MSFDEDSKTFSDYEAAVIGERRKAKDELLDELIEWVNGRIDDERGPYEQAWNKMLRELLERRKAL